MASSCHQKLKISKTYYRYKAFSRRNFKSPQKIPVIAWHLRISTQLRKYAVADIIPSKTKKKKHGSKLKFFVSIFQKLDQINICNWGKWQLLKVVRFFLTYISDTFGTIKPTCRAAIIIIINLFHFDFEVGHNMQALQND